MINAHMRDPPTKPEKHIALLIPVAEPAIVRSIDVVCLVALGRRTSEPDPHHARESRRSIRRRRARKRASGVRAFSVPSLPQYGGRVRTGREGTRGFAKCSYRTGEKSMCRLRDLTGRQWKTHRTTCSRSPKTTFLLAVKSSKGNSLSGPLKTIKSGHSTERESWESCQLRMGESSFLFLFASECPSEVGSCICLTDCSVSCYVTCPRSRRRKTVLSSLFFFGM